MMADLDDLSARASNLLVEMKLDAPVPPRSEAPRREASRKDRDEQLQRRQDGGSCQTRQTRASPPLATGQLFHEGSRPPKRGPTNQPETAMLPAVVFNAGRRDAMDTSG